jgi:hypothetical protein
MNLVDRDSKLTLFFSSFCVFANHEAWFQIFIDLPLTNFFTKVIIRWVVLLYLQQITFILVLNDQ